MKRLALTLLVGMFALSFAGSALAKTSVTGYGTKQFNADGTVTITVTDGTNSMSITLDNNDNDERDSIKPYLNACNEPKQKLTITETTINGKKKKGISLYGACSLNIEFFGEGGETYSPETESIEY